MADSFDRASSNLLCSEDSNTFFVDFECNAADESEISLSLNHQNSGSYHYSESNSDGFESVLGFSVQSEETVRSLAERERVYMPRDDYLGRLRSGDLDLSVRREALDWIWKVHTYYGFGPLSFCLSINYFDRLLSIYTLPSTQKWTGQVLAVACLSIAAKVEETKVPQSVDLQVGGPKFIFEAKTIQRMELLVLSTLQWKMHAVTPCSFIDFFLSKFTYHQHTVKSSISRSIQLILSTIRGIDFLEFKPSEIAAAVAISVSGELQATEIDRAITCFGIVQKERVLKCIELIRDLSLVKFSSGKLGRNSEPFVPQSPMGVLDAASLSLSYKSEELTGVSCPNSSHDSRNTWRNKSGKPQETSKS